MLTFARSTNFRSRSASVAVSADGQQHVDPVVATRKPQDGDYPALGRRVRGELCAILESSDVAGQLALEE